MDKQMQKATLTALTPVHIGCGNTLMRNVGFVIAGNKAGFIDLDKLAAKLGNNAAAISAMTAAIEQGKPLTGLLPKNVQPMEICNVVADARGSFNDVKELIEHYRTPLLGPCIPGSSLKGAIRTCLWNALTDSNSMITVNDMYSIRKSFNGEKWQWGGERIGKQLFGNNANTNSMRFLQIGDCHFQNVVTEVDEVGIMNMHGGKNNISWKFKDSRFLAELIPQDSVGALWLKADERLLDKNRKQYPEKWESINTEWTGKDMAALAQIINNYTIRLLQEEIDILEGSNFADTEEGDEMLNKYYAIMVEAEALNKDGSGFVVRVGANSGWKFMTGNWMFSGRYEAMFTDEQKNKLSRQIRRKEYDTHFLTPKTRKMLTDGTPLGFVKVVLGK